MKHLQRCGSQYMDAFDGHAFIKKGLKKLEIHVEFRQSNNEFQFTYKS